MDMVIRSKIIKIGNSRGIRIPRMLLEQANLVDDIEITVQGGKLIIHAIHEPRMGWDDQFLEMAARGDDKLLDDTVPTQWDDDEWTW